MVIDLFQVLDHIIHDFFGFFRVPLLDGIFHFVQQFLTDFTEIIHEVQRVLYLMGDTGGEFTQAGHFFRLHQLLLGSLQYSHSVLPRIARLGMPSL